ncbi:Gfo/Idh/MocA family oxidoreductase [Streptomyces sp. NPDC048845]|uniref:Gfo/Idh/MocA family protein n=1 Tax=Streptomyces sp. NPDC048845 TaxID=3155390 RepID=UPI0034412244
MRIGLLGTGPWAARVHAPALAAHPVVTLTGVWGRRPGAAAQLAAANGTRAYDDPDALFADVDAVSIALPPDVQAPLAARAAAAGCHLLLDKPVATTAGDAHRIAAAAGRGAVASVVFFTVRHDPAPETWITEQAAKGGWFTAHADWVASLFADGSPPGPFTESPWRRERGALWDVGPHALSVLLPALGDVTGPDAVRAVRGPGDTVQLVLRHTGGATSTATLSLTAPAAAAGAGVELRGEHGVATLPDGGIGPEAAFARAVDALLDSVRTGEPHPCDIRFGVRVTEILEAAEADLARGPATAG